MFHFISKNKDKILVIQHVVLVIYLILWGFLIYKCFTPHKKTIIFNKSSDKTCEVSFNIHPTKQWYDGKSTLLGAQYDGTIKNNTSSELLDWSVIIKVSSNSYIDSSWNGLFALEDNEIFIHCDKKLDNSFIDPYSFRTFGCILYSLPGYTPKVIQASFTTKYFIHKTVLFWILLAFTFIGIGQWVSYVIFKFKVRILEQKEKIATEITEQTMKTFANAIEIKDKYTKGHSSRVSEYAKAFAKYLNLPEDMIQKIYYAAILHDVGKIMIPDEILNKSSSLTEEELKIMRNHASLSYDILKDFTSIKNLAMIVRSHHENFDGTGYPDGIKGEDIPLESRIITIADHYDAMTSKRIYNHKLSIEKAIEELEKYSGTKYDPKLVPPFIELLKQNFISDD